MGNTHLSLSSMSSIISSGSEREILTCYHKACHFQSLHEGLASKCRHLQTLESNKLAEKTISLRNAKCLNQTQRPLPHDGFQKLQPGEGPQLVGPQLVRPQLVGPQLVGPLMMGGPLLPARQQLKEFVACLQTKKCSAERLLQI